MKTLGIDIGNFGTKTSEGFYVPSKVKASTSIFGEKGIKLILKNKEYIIGNGNYETETVKTKKDNFYPLLLTAIAKSFKEDNILVNIALGLPLNQYNKEKKNLKENILNNYKTSILTIDDNLKTVNINKVLIVPEGIGALYGIKNSDNIDKNNVVVVDVGGLTTNIYEIEDGVIIKDSTLEIGMLQIYNYLNLSLKRDYTDLKLTFDKLNNILEKGVFLYYGEERSAYKYINELKPFVNEVYNNLKMNYSIESKQVVFLGGGSRYFCNIIREKIKHSIQIEDVFANANGFKVIGEEVFGKK